MPSVNLEQAPARSPAIADKQGVQNQLQPWSSKATIQAAPENH